MQMWNDEPISETLLSACVNIVILNWNSTKGQTSPKYPISWMVNIWSKWTLRNLVIIFSQNNGNVANGGCVLVARAQHFFAWFISCFHRLRDSKSSVCCKMNVQNGNETFHLQETPVSLRHQCNVMAVSQLICDKDERLRVMELALMACKSALQVSAETFISECTLC